MSKPEAKRAAGIAVDLLMYILLLVQMLYVFTGNTVHEILGIAFFVCLIVHLIIKRKQIAPLFRLGKKSAARRTADTVTLLLTLASAALMLSSMGVSRLILPQFTYFGSADMHVYLATAVLALALFHGSMHVYLRTKKKKLTAAFIAVGCIAAIAVGLALVPYLDRHFKTVRIDYSSAVNGKKTEWKDRKPLVVYFTRLGNTDFEENIDAVSGASLLLADGELMGSNQLIADMVQNALDCDVKAITLTGERYPSSYGDTVSAAGRELRSKARPAIEPIDVSGYDDIILVYPLWWGTVPMPVASFLESGGLSGKDIYLIATQGSSGYGSSVKNIKAMAKGAEVHEVMSIYCEDIPFSRESITEALERIVSGEH